MIRSFWVLLVTLHITLVGGCLPAPPAYDHAMLREYFGRSPADVEAFLGKPEEVKRASLENAETATSNPAKPSMVYTYSTTDGELVFLFNEENQVSQIIYAGIDVSPSKP